MNAITLLKWCLKNISRDKKGAFLNFSILWIAFISIASVSVVMSNIRNLIKGAQNEFQMTIYLQNNATREDIKNLTGALQQFNGIAKVKYISQENFRNLFVNDGIGVNIAENELFPSALQVKFSQDFATSQLAKQLVEKLKKLDTVEEIDFHENRLKNLATVLSVSWFLLLGFASLLFLSSLLVEANIIQLSFSKRQKAIEVMRLCGATNAFIEIPVLLEGLFLGLLSSIAAVLVIWIATVIINSQISSALNGFAKLNLTFISPAQCFLIIFLSGVACMTGAIIASRKTLRV